MEASDGGEEEVEECAGGESVAGRYCTRASVTIGVSTYSLALTWVPRVSLNSAEVGAPWSNTLP